MKLKELVIGDLVAKVPIVQGGMGVGISLNGLAAAVANEGGIGVLATSGIAEFEPDVMKNFVESHNRALRNQIRLAREKSNGIIGVNIMVAFANYADMVKCSIEEKIDIIFSGAGLPLNLPEYLPAKGEGHRPKLVPIVSSGKGAALIARRWTEKFDYLPDAFVLEGPKAGGHLGFKKEHLFDDRYQLEVLLKELIDALKPVEEKYGKKIPLIVGGGIFTGSDIHKFMALGADGVQMATRFVATHECDASDIFKQTYIDAKEEDVVIIDSPLGMPGRAVRNQFLTDVSLGQKKPFKCPYHCIIPCDYHNAPYCIALALTKAKIGEMQDGFSFAGSNVYRVDKIVSVKELMAELVAECESC